MTQTDGLGSPEADTDGASEPSHLRCTEKKGLMSPEQDCRETEDGGRNAESSNTEVESQLCTSSVGERKRLEMSDRGGRIPALLLIITRQAVNLGLLCSQ